MIGVIAPDEPLIKLLERPAPSHALRWISLAGPNARTRSK